MKKKSHKAAGRATDRSLTRKKITSMKEAEAGTAEAPFMEVISFLFRLRSVAQPAAEGDFFYMSPKPVHV